MSRASVQVPVTDPTYTVNEFCRAERMSRCLLYQAWREGWGPKYYLNGSHRRITHRARLQWQIEREQAALGAPTTKSRKAAAEA
jgi:hypothetical protein